MEALHVTLRLLNKPRTSIRQSSRPPCFPQCGVGRGTGVGQRGSGCASTDPTSMRRPNTRWKQEVLCDKSSKEPKTFEIKSRQCSRSVRGFDTLIADTFDRNLLLGELAMVDGAHIRSEE